MTDSPKPFSRREVLTTFGAAASAASLWPGTAPAATAALPLSSRELWEWVRAQPLLQAGSLERDLAEAARDGKQEADATRGAVLDRVDQTLARRKRDQQVDWLRQRLKRGYRSAPGNVLFAGIDGDQFAAKGRGEAGKDLSPQLVDARRCTEHGNRSRREEAGEIKSDHGVSAQYPRKRFGRSGSSRSVAAGPSMTMAPPLGTQRQSACARAIGTLCSALSSVMPCS